MGKPSDRRDKTLVRIWWTNCLRKKDIRSSRSGPGKKQSRGNGRKYHAVEITVQGRTRGEEGGEGIRVSLKRVNQAGAVSRRGSEQRGDVLRPKVKSSFQ